MALYSPITIFWFRRDLRFDDNAGLWAALQEDYPVLPLFIFDKAILENLNNPHDPRVTFIHNRLELLNEQLHQKDSTLLVRYGYPEDVFSSLIQNYTIRKVITNRDYEPYAFERDRRIAALLGNNHIEFRTCKDQVIFEPWELKTGNNTPYKVQTPYKNAWLQKWKHEKPAPFPNGLTASINWFKAAPETLPPLASMGFQETGVPVPKANLDYNALKQYEQFRDYPSSNVVSKQGIHLRFGTWGVRTIMYEAEQLNSTWMNELIWREFFMQLLYHFPHTVNQPLNAKYNNVHWRYNEEDFRRWCRGTTGIPIVDAGMRELNNTGYMHNRVRMITACFLTKNLMIDWRWGERYFAEKLLDFELASNVGNWQWVAGCGADAQPYFRIFNPWTQQKKFDPDETYIRRWIPELDTEKYPAPMIDYKESRKQAINYFKTVLNQ